MIKYFKKNKINDWSYAYINFVLHLVIILLNTNFF